MFEAQVLDTGDTVFSPWFPRQGDSAIFTLDVVDIDGGAAANQITVQVFTKNSEDAGSGSQTGSDITRDGTEGAGQAGAEYGSLKELVRYKFSVTGTGTRVLFRMLPPSWFDSVKA